MKRYFLSFSCLSVVLVAGTIVTAQKPAPKVRPAPNELIVGKAQTFGNLTLFPICTPTLQKDDRFTTLDEGIKAGTVEIREVGAAGGDDAGNDVNRLTVVNKSKKPL